MDRALRRFSSPSSGILPGVLPRPLLYKNAKASAVTHAMSFQTSLSSSGRHQIPVLSSPSSLRFSNSIHVTSDFCYIIYGHWTSPTPVSNFCSALGIRNILLDVLLALHVCRSSFIKQTLMVVIVDRDSVQQ